MTKFIVRAKPEGALSFGTEHNRGRFIDFLRKEKLWIWELTPKKEIKPEARGYVYGALAPAYCEWSENYDRKNQSHVDEVAELLLIHGFGKIITGLDGSPARIRPSTQKDKMSDPEYKAGIDKIIRYFEENEIPVPDTELYKRWQDQWRIEEPELSYFDWLDKNNMRCDGSKKLL